MHKCQYCDRVATHNVTLTDLSKEGVKTCQLHSFVCYVEIFRELEELLSILATNKIKVDEQAKV